jgi:hypothetical protein
MLCTDVTPRAATYFIAAASARSSISLPGAGAFDSTSDIALSLSNPVSRPRGSRTISPPLTSC